jgi:hypothetical protein
LANVSADDFKNDKMEEVRGYKIEREQTDSFFLSLLTSSSSFLTSVNADMLSSIASLANFVCTASSQRNEMISSL